MTVQIVIDSTSRILYSSYYIKGLYEVFGKENVSFGRKHFKNLHRQKEQFSFEHFFAFVSITDTKITKFIVDFCDPPDINQEAYNWCDVYAKINFDNHQNDAEMSKLIIIPPSFGIRIWNLQQTFYYCWRNFLATPRSLPTTINKFFKDYYQQYKREPIESYLVHFKIKQIKKPFIFMIGTLWKDTDNAKITNQKRKNFIEACKKIDNCEFEGGLYFISKDAEYEKYKDIIFSKPYSIKEYIRKTKLSDIVFNTPAVHNCHGWKLAEFLAMGKPIISTTLSYELHTPLCHGKNIHIIDNESEIQSSIENILRNQEYKQLLGENAAKYFLEYMTPSSVITQVFEKGHKL